MTGRQNATIACLTRYPQKQAFMSEANRLGARVVLITSEELRSQDWPTASLDDIIYFRPEDSQDQIAQKVATYNKKQPIKRLVALDEFGLELAALLREHLQLPGLTTARTKRFRDKLDMRTRASFCGIRVPQFVDTSDHNALVRFLEAVPPPWLLKPRGGSVSIGIEIISDASQLWPLLAKSEQHSCILEQFLVGQVCHVEGISWKGQVLCSLPHKYGEPPLQTVQTDGIFSTQTLDSDEPLGCSLIETHARVLSALEFDSGVTHTEFLISPAGDLFFLETAARLGGYYIPETVQAATGLSLWTEWAKIEVALLFDRAYELPSIGNGFASCVGCHTSDETPSLMNYVEPEIVFRLAKDNTAGLILRSQSTARIQQLTSDYRRRFTLDFRSAIQQSR